MRGRVRRAGSWPRGCSRPGGDSGSSTRCCGTTAACSSASGPARPSSTAPSTMGQTLLVSGPVRFYHGRQLAPREFVILADADGDAEPLLGGQGAAGLSRHRGPGHKVIRVADRPASRRAHRALARTSCPSRSARSLGLPALPEALRAVHRPAIVGGGGGGPPPPGVRRAARPAADAHPRACPRQAAAQRHRVRDQAPAHDAAFASRCPGSSPPTSSRRFGEITGDMTAPERMHRLLHGRCRHREDGRRALRDAARGGERLPGRADGADASCSPSSTPRRSTRLLAAAGASCPSCCWAGSRPPTSRPCARGSRRAQAALVDRHARAHAGERVVPAARPGGDRRAAPLRRGAAGGAHRQGRGARRAAADRDADPALARPHALRRSRRVHSARAPAGPWHASDGASAGEPAGAGPRVRAGGVRARTAGVCRAAGDRGVGACRPAGGDDHGAELSQRAGPISRSGLVHGRLKADERDDVMRRFRDGEVRRAGGHDGHRGRASTCPTPPSWSSSIPSASAWRSSTSSGDVWGAAPTRVSAFCSPTGPAPSGSGPLPATA